MFRNFVILGGLLAALASPGAGFAQDTGTLTLRSITAPIVPTRVLSGDREFGGNGPNLHVDVSLYPARNGRAIFARVLFDAREIGGDGSHTQIETDIEVWRWKPSDGPRFVERVLNANFRRTIESASTCPGTCLGSEDGAMMMRMPGAGPVDSVRLIGDTMGDDISTDNNAHGDTSIRGIFFRPVTVIFTDRLTGS